MVLPIFSTGVATHTNDLAPDLPALPHAYPEQECVQMPSIDESILADLNERFSGEDGPFALDDQGVPALCAEGLRVNEWEQLIRDADATLETFRNLTRDIQRQYDARLEHTLPGGSREECIKLENTRHDANTETPAAPGIACDLVRPQFTLLSEHFDGRRVGGFGEWQVFVDGGGESGFRNSTVLLPDGRRESTLRFGEDDGYERGTHQFLVSPELDLGSIAAANRETTQALMKLRAEALGRLYVTCNEFTLSPGTPGTLMPVCGEGGDLGFITFGSGSNNADIVVAAYQRAMDDLLRDLPAMQPGATLEFAYRLNMADATDGVRMWIYTGDDAPTSKDLFGDLGDKSEIRCAHNSAIDVDGTADANVIDCQPGEGAAVNEGQALNLTSFRAREGGTVLIVPGETRDTEQFSKSSRVAQRGAPFALTGDTGGEFRTIRINLTEFVPQRAWVMFEVLTQRDDGNPFFEDTGKFQRHRDYGFDIADVLARGEGYHRNVRVKDVAANFDRMPEDNPYADTRDTRAIRPPGNDPIVVRLHNAGQYVENGTLTATMQHARGGSTVTGTYTQEIRDFASGRVVQVAIPIDGFLRSDGTPAFADALLAGDRITVTATLDVEAGDVNGLNNPGIRANATYLQDPNNTAVRTPNVADMEANGGPAFGTNTVQQTTIVRAYVERSLALLSPKDERGGNPIYACASYDPDAGGCLQAFTGKRGEARLILVKVENAGTTTEDVTATLSVTRDGLDQSDEIAGDATIDLPALAPGESRLVSWTLQPTDIGIYEIQTTFRADGLAPSKWASAQRDIYVGRTTGTICFDDLASQRACAPAFASDRPDELVGKDITAAAIDAEDALVLTTLVTEDSGTLYRRNADGTWTNILNISHASLAGRLGLPNATARYANVTDIVFAPDGSIFLVMESGFVVKRAPSGDLSASTVYKGVEIPELRAGAWFNDTLWVVGSGGFVGFLNGTRLDRVNLTHGNETHTVTVTSALNDLAVHKSRLIVAGDYGLVFTTKGSHWRNDSNANLSAAWTIGVSPDNENMNGNDKLPNRMRDIQRLLVANNRVYAVGESDLLLISSDGVSYTLAAAPPLYSETTYVDAFRTHLNELWLLDDQGRFARCAGCTTPSAAGWDYPEVPVPMWVEDDAPHRSGLVMGVAGESVTIVVGEAGLLLEYADRTAYENAGDWSVQNPLSANRGVFETPWSANGQIGTFRGTIPSENKSAASGADTFRVTVRHYVDRADDANPATIRLLAVPYPGGRVNTGNQETCPTDSSNTGNPVPTGGVAPTEYACSQVMIGEPLQFTEPTRSDSWQTDVFTRSAFSSGTPLAFDSIEFNARLGTRWTVDFVRVEACSSSCATILLWDDYTGVGNLGAWDDYVLPVVDPAQGNAWTVAADAFYPTTPNPWHMTFNLTDRPVWVVNDELWPTPAEGGAGGPRLRDHWDTRLVTPVIDLSNAFDPVVVFRHAYAMRTIITDVGYDVGDAGLVEVQWMLSPEECADLKQTHPCWSDFHKLTPEGGYPTAKDLFGADIAQRDTDVPHSAQVAVGPLQSFFGQMVAPNEEGVIEGVRYVDSDNYAEVRIPLTAQTSCSTEIEYTCLPVNLSGRQVRIGFHLTGPTSRLASGAPAGTSLSEFEYTNFDQQSKNPTSFPGEGWYIADFKVLGARPLGIDLRATNATFRVGYDVERVGVGPGTSVPINVTVENRGRFDVPGYTGELEIRRVTDPVARLTEVVETIRLSQQPLLEPGKYANHTFRWDVPTRENAQYAMRFVVRPIGIDVDEDATDNVQHLGTIAQPVVARTTREFHVDFVVTPENATSDITRYVPIFLNNTGNVPLDDIEVKRIVSLVRNGLQNPETRAWRTTAPVPAGTVMPLALVSDEVNPATDLFWKAPDRAKFDFTVTAKAGTITSSAQRVIAAYATYLFDDIEGGVRGESVQGEWKFDAAWGVSSPGFLTPNAYAFGDASSGRYPADANDAATTPTIDIANARSARVAFYHRYAFEPRYDGGLVEASADGGKTWHALTPLPDELNELPFGYNRSLPLSAASALHVDGNPDHATYGFTGDSCELPAAVDCWVLSEFDLTQFPPIREVDAVYTQHDAAALGGLVIETNASVPLTGEPIPRVATASSWYRNELDYWATEDLSLYEIQSPVGDDTIWWSGSLYLQDDGLKPAKNQLLNVPVDLTSVTDEKTSVVVEWWEWVERFAKDPEYVGSMREGDGQVSRPLYEDLHGAFTWHPVSTYPQSYRFNITPPTIIEQRGQWFRIQADITEFKGEDVTLGFLYTPYRNTTSPLGTPQPRTTDVYAHDRGFAVDAFNVRTYQLANGKVTNERVLLDEDAAWAGANVEACMDYEAVGLRDPPCFKKFAENNPTDRYFPHYCEGTGGNVQCGERPALPINVTGETWSLVTAAPGLGMGGARLDWNITGARPNEGLRDETGDGSTPTGETSYAWYSGDTVCSAVTSSTCLPPGAETRLITPSFDLARVAGTTASLTFWHRYAFPEVSAWREPLASGGVVEMQILDPQTGEWGDWQQIYAGATNRTENGGYSAYTANFTKTQSNLYRRLDSPFEPHYDPALKTDVQFLYSGRSDQQPGCQSNGWCQARFDVSGFLGQTVRFGFHVHMSGLDASQIAANRASGNPPYLLPNPDNWQGTRAGGHGGWWLKDFAIVGDVLKAVPVQLRLRAATDGNVDEGRWQVDDIGAYGSRYEENVGIFLEDDRTGAYGLVSKGSTTIPVTIKNLGSSVRRDLALEVIDTQQSGDLRDRVSINFTGVGPGKVSWMREGEARYTVRFEGFTLVPGQSANINLVVSTNDGFTTQDKKWDLTLRLREFNAATGAFEAVVGNEVQGFLQRTVTLGLDTNARVEIENIGVNAAVLEAGEPAEFTVTAFNKGFVRAGIELDCTADLVRGWTSLDHSTIENAEDQPVVVATYPCAPSGRAPYLDPLEWQNHTFTVTPTQPGSLRVTFSGRVLDNLTNLTYVTQRFSIPVETPPVIYHETFDSPDNLTQNFTGNAHWSQFRGRSGVGAAVLGVNESTKATGGSLTYASDAANEFGCPTGGTAGANCTLRTKAVDLHNFSAQSVYLTFWHMDRMARGDGADVNVQWLVDEAHPNDVDAWSGECRLVPEGGYDGPILSLKQSQPDPEGGGTAGATRDDWNVRFDPGTAFDTVVASPDHYFTNPRWENDWSLARFDLSEQDCDVLGRTVRFVFHAYLADDKSEPLPDAAGSPIGRGYGHGFVIDDIVISPLALGVRPTLQSATLLDNTTKGFHVLLTNLGDFTDTVTLAFDADASSAPRDSVRPPSEPITLAPGETRTVLVEVTLPRDPSLLPTIYKARVLVKSTLDPNAGGETGLDLFFAPREWAELSVRAEAPDAGVQEGTEVFIPITVENTGLIPNVPSVLKIVDSYPGADDVVTFLDIPPMSSYFASPEDAARVLEFQWRPAKGTLGMHTLTITADPDVRGEEYTRTNNVVVLQVPVVEVLIPDLDISPREAIMLRNADGAALPATLDGDVARYDIGAGELVTIEVAVRNLGRAGATDVDVLASIGSLNLPARTIPYIAPGSEVVVKFNWLAQKGDYDLSFKVRSEQVESRTDNNDNPAQGVTRLTVKGFEIAVLLDAVDGVKEVGETFLVPYTLTNEGNAGEELRLVARAEGIDVTLDRSTLFLRDGETLEGQLAVKVPAHAVAGEHVITVQAVARQNPMKVSEAERVVDVEALYGGATIPTTTRVSPPSFTVPVRLQNDGNSLEPWTVNLQLPPGWTSRTPLPTRLAVPAYGEATHELVIDAPATTAPGERDIRVTATMPDGNVTAGNIRVDVVERRAASVKLMDALPRSINGALAYPVTIENAGNTADPFEMILLEEPEGVKVTFSPATFDLAPGTKTVATLLVTPEAGMEANEVGLAGYTLFAGVQPDTAEGKANLQPLRVSIARPDLRVSQADVTPRSGVEPGDRVEAKITVENRGASPVMDLPVHLYVDDVFVAERLVNLSAGERRDVRVNWTALPGDHTLTLVVDPYQQAAEADREDNAVSALASVAGEALGGGIAAGSPVPGFGAWGAIVALAVALTVFTRTRRPKN